jgi:hypothetical protein
VWALLICGAICVAAFIAARFAKPDRMSAEQVASEIEKFIEGRGATYDWDDFISVSLSDPFLDEIREKASATHELYPPPNGKG